jgi:galactofuranosylgalactofuranosylrhamnosyl-N-acetylglucosaminyl-diphospho-decaprenol beta-1,5/1,6-galactofuranosyltransferase
MRYGLAALTNAAIESFLEGPDTLHDGGQETAARVRALWSAHPETRNHPAHAVPDVPRTARSRTAPGGTPSMMRAVLAKRILWQLLGRARGTAGIAAADAHWWHVSLFDTAVVTDPSQEGVRVRRFDRDLMVDLARRAGRTLWRLAREGDKVRDEYVRRLPELSSRETWSRLYDGM